MLIVLQQDKDLGDYIHIIAGHKWIDGLPAGHFASNLAEKMGGKRETTDPIQLTALLKECDSRFNYGENNARGGVKSSVFPENKLKEINSLYKDYLNELPDDIKKKFTLPVFLQYVFNEAAGSEGSALAIDQDINVQLDQYRMPGTLTELREHIKLGNWRSVAAFCDIYGASEKSAGRIPERSNIKGLLGKATLQLQDPKERLIFSGLTAMNFGIGEKNFAIGAPISGQTMTSVIPERFQMRTDSVTDVNGVRKYKKDIIGISGFGGPAKALFQRGPAMTLTYAIDEKGDLTQLVVRTKANWDKQKLH
jgi:hypothetical protein